MHVLKPHVHSTSSSEQMCWCLFYGRIITYVDSWSSTLPSALLACCQVNTHARKSTLLLRSGTHAYMLHFNSHLSIPVTFIDLATSLTIHLNLHLCTYTHTHICTRVHTNTERSAKTLILGLYSFTSTNWRDAPAHHHTDLRGHMCFT